MSDSNIRTIGQWTVFMDTDERFAPPKHQCIAAGRRWATQGVEVGLSPVHLIFDPDGLPEGLSGDEALERYMGDLDALIVPTFWVQDYKGEVALTYTNDIRALRRDKFPDVPPVGMRGFAIPGDAKVGYCGSAAVLKCPHAARALEAGDYQQALALAEKYKNLHFFRRIHLLALKMKNTAEALVAFERLYRHYSLNEELWRLGELFKLLPYDLEDHPRIAELFAQYKRQTSHLDEGETKWYAEGSPAESVNDWWVTAGSVSARLHWVAQEAMRLGYKRIVELGSVDGGSLFSLMQRFPHIEWHGVEVNQLAVANGKALAARHGLLERFKLHHAKSFPHFAARVEAAEAARFKGQRSDITKFDGVMVFEVLEHNNPSECLRILEAARACVRPGGRVFVTTPNGNWSLHDDHTQDLELRKDHINAFTARRMRALLESLTYATDVQVMVVENDAYFEANSWVFASFEVKA